MGFSFSNPPYMPYGKVATECSLALAPPFLAVAQRFLALTPPFLALAQRFLELTLWFLALALRFLVVAQRFLALAPRFLGLLRPSLHLLCASYRPLNGCSCSLNGCFGLKKQ